MFSSDSILLYFICGLLLLILLLLFYIASKLRKKSRNEPDWSRVYPELMDMNDADEAFDIKSEKRPVTGNLDQMLMEDSSDQLPDKPAREYYKEDIRKVKLESDADEVMCTTYAPEAVSRDEEFIIAAFAHYPDKAGEAGEIAKMIDDEIVKRAEKYLPLKIEKGHSIGFLLKVEGCEVDDEYQEIPWFGRTESVEFGVIVPAEYKRRAVTAKIDISVNSIPVGNMKFRVKLEQEEKIDYSNTANVHAEKYKRAFISYASGDRAEVLRRTQMLSAIGITFFQDIMNIKPGEEWEKKLYEEIDSCDVFYLFWSKAAHDSKWVRQEWEYAIKLQNQKSRPEIIPVPIEGPPSVSPPGELSHLHFNDGFLFFLNNS